MPLLIDHICTTFRLSHVPTILKTPMVCEKSGTSKAIRTDLLIDANGRLFLTLSVACRDISLLTTLVHIASFQNGVEELFPNLLIFLAVYISFGWCTNHRHYLLTTYCQLEMAFFAEKHWGSQHFYNWPLFDSSISEDLGERLLGDFQSQILTFSLYFEVLRNFQKLSTLHRLDKKRLLYSRYVKELPLQ